MIRQGKKDAEAIKQAVDRGMKELSGADDAVFGHRDKNWLLIAPCQRRRLLFHLRQRRAILSCSLSPQRGEGRGEG